MPEAGALSGPSESRAAAWRLYRMWGVPFRASFQREGVRLGEGVPPRPAGRGVPVGAGQAGVDSRVQLQLPLGDGELWDPRPGAPSPSQVVSRENSTSQAASPYLGTSAGGDGAHRQEGRGPSEERAVGELHRLSDPEKVVGAGALLCLLGRGSAGARPPAFSSADWVQDRPLGLTGEDMPAPQNAQKDQQDPGQKKRQTLMGGKIGFCP